MSKDDKKNAILTRILENKEVLFGAFSIAITNKVKAKAWQEILDEGTRIELFKNDSSIEKVKAFWQTEKTKFLNVNRIRKHTGSGAIEISETSKIVENILGKDSPIVKGIGLNESLREKDIKKERKTLKQFSKEYKLEFTGEQKKQLAKLNQEIKLLEKENAKLRAIAKNMQS